MGSTKSAGSDFERTQCGPKGETQEVFLNPEITRYRASHKSYGHIVMGMR